MAGKVRQIGGRMGDYDDLEKESETPLSSIPLPDVTKVTEVIPGVFDATSEAVVDLGKALFGFGEKFTPKGEIKDFQNAEAAKVAAEKKKAEAQLARARVQIVTQEEIIVTQQKKLNAQKETTRLIGSNLSSEDKKGLLHLSLDYSDEHIQNPYHLVNLRQKLKEQTEAKKKAEDAQKAQEVPKGKKGGINLNKVAEGGQAQLSTTGGGGIG